MEILREGKEMPSYVFSCKRCGCIWRAKEGEYVELKGREEAIYKGLFYVYCKCPNCRLKAMMKGRYKEYGGNGIFDKYKVDLSKILETENEG
jgi:hypothetical protein